jgi:ketosteroid isomerase-like protein
MGALEINTVLSTRSQEPYSSAIYLNNDAVFGWESLKAGITMRMNRFKQQQDFYSKYEIIDLKIYIDGNVAFSTYKSKFEGREDGEDYTGFVNKIFFVFEKKNNEWKIVFEGYSEGDFGEEEKIEK